MSETFVPVGRVQVGIVGAGPAGLVLARLLAQAGISCLVVERQSRAHVEARIRAGVLEPASVALLERAGVASRLKQESLRHEGFELAFGDERLRIDLTALTGEAVTVYGQTELTLDLNRLHAATGTNLAYGCEDVTLDGLEGETPELRFTHGGREHRVRCDFIVGCDGFHGVSRASIPAALRRECERIYPVAWLGVLADTPPVSPELVYARHARGFALCSMRSPTRSRYYLQVPATENLAEWPDERFWEELHARLPAVHARALKPAASVEKSMAPLRSFVCETMRHGRLFLAGDAAHIVPPTGAKGLNLALADVARLADGLTAWYFDRDDAPLDAYPTACLARVWQAERFSWWFTSITHQLSDDPFSLRLQEAEFAHLKQSQAAQLALAQGYMGRFSA